MLSIKPLHKRLVF